MSLAYRTVFVETSIPHLLLNVNRETLKFPPVTTTCVIIPEMDEFVTWLTEELDKRGWTGSELARRAGLVPSTVSTVISGAKRPGLDFCVGVGRALSVRPEEVLRRAGLLPALPAPVADEGEALTLLRELSGGERSLIIRQLRALASAPAAHGVNERQPAYNADTDLQRFYRVAERLARLPDGPIRNDAIAYIEAIAERAEKRAAIEPASPHEEPAPE